MSERAVLSGWGVDTHRHLHVLLDGEDLGVAAADTPLTHPCYACL